MRYQIAFVEFEIFLGDSLGFSIKLSNLNKLEIRHSNYIIIIFFDQSIIARFRRISKTKRKSLRIFELRLQQRIGH